MIAIRRHGTGWLADAPAKLNLFLEVLGKRPDGFHDIETLMCPVDLFDTLSLSRTPGQSIQLQIQPGAALGAEDLPTGSNNIVVRALELFQKRFNRQAGLLVHLTKRIPLAAGMAGGSSDAAAALLLAARLFEVQSQEALQELAAELGSDVPFFLGKGAALCRGRGTEMEPWPALGFLHFVVVRPPQGLSTADVYRNCRAAQTPRSTDTFCDTLYKGRVRLIHEQLYNRLQPAAAALSPWVDRLKQEFARHQLLGHQMSGSGTAYYGVCLNRQQALRLGRAILARQLGQTFVLRGCL